MSNLESGAPVVTRTNTVFSPSGPGRLLFTDAVEDRCLQTWHMQSRAAWWKGCTFLETCCSMSIYLTS